MGRKFQYDIIGKEFTNNAGSKFIVKQTNEKNNRNKTQYICEFETGWTCFAASSDIRKGKVKDMLFPTVCGFGKLGELGRNAKQIGKPYWIWLGMIRRCYDKSAPFYKWYGGNGVTVCERWSRFDFFMQDIENIPGYDIEKINNHMLDLDKDIRVPGSKIYSPETCMFVSHEVNLVPVHEKRKKTA